MNVVNCFQISIFAVHEQQINPTPYVTGVVNCFQISIFAVHEQPIVCWETGETVVNCFQISIFAVHEQHGRRGRYIIVGCELLSN